MAEVDNGGVQKSSASRKKRYQELDPETRMKRVAQNRAAQKAFRERKERKMKELERKVVDLENLTKLNEVETNFLRDQLSILVKELRKYRPETKQDHKVLKYLEKHKGGAAGAGNGAATGSVSTSTRHTDLAASNANRVSKDSSILPGAKIIRQDLESFNENRHFNVTGQLTPPGNTSSSTTANSVAANAKKQSIPHSDSSDSNESKNTWNTDPTSSEDWLDDVMTSHKQISRGQSGSGIDFNNFFDEQVSEFCTKLNQACGTKACPIPQSKSAATTPLPGTSSNGNSNSPMIINDTMGDVSLNMQGNEHGNATNNLVTDPAFLSNTWDDMSPASNQHSTGGAPGFGQLGFGDNLLGNDILFSPNSPAYSPSVLGSGRTQEVYRSPAVQKVVEKENESKSVNFPFINSSLAFPGDYDNNFFRETTDLNFDDNDQDDNFTNSNDLVNDYFTTNIPDTDNSDSALIANGLVKEEPSMQTEDTFKVQNTNDMLNSSRMKETIDNQNIGEKTTKDDNEDDDEDDENDNTVVPSRDDGLLRCSEIWDRITAHPKYSDIDIDGLCSELMAKAKCSERGVVINADDVQVALNKHMS